MSKHVDTLTFTENGGGSKKEININFGDIVARETADDAKVAAVEALQKSAGAPTDNYDVNRIILACSTMDGNDAIPLALPEGAKFRLYVNRDDEGTFTDLEIENADDSGEVHPLEHGYNWIYWSSLDVAMNLYVNIGVLEDNFIYPDDVIDFAFTSATTSEVSIALMTALYRIDDAENLANSSIEQAAEAKEVAQEAKSVSRDITDNSEVNKIILAATIMNDESVLYIDEVPTLEYTIKVKSSKEFILTDDDDNTYTLKEGLNYIYLLDGVNDGNTLILLIDFNCVKFGDININDEFKFHFTPTISKTTTRSIINSIERSNGCATTDWRVNNVILSMYEYSGEKFWLHIFYDGEDDKFEVSIERDRTGDVIKCVDGLNKIEFPFRSNASGLKVYLYIDLDGGYVIDRIGPNDSLRIPFYAKDRYDNLKLNRVMWEMIRSLTSRIEVLESKIQQTEK